MDSEELFCSRPWSWRTPMRLRSSLSDARVKRRDESGTSLDPHRDRLLRAAPRRCDEHVAIHRATGKVHRTHVRSTERLLVALRPDAHHQVVHDNAAAHLSAEQECKATEHLLLGGSRGLTSARRIRSASRSSYAMSQPPSPSHRAASRRCFNASKNPDDASFPIDRLELGMRG